MEVSPRSLLLPPARRWDEIAQARSGVLRGTMAGRAGDPRGTYAYIAHDKRLVRARLGCAVPVINAKARLDSVHAKPFHRAGRRKRPAPNEVEPLGCYNVLEVFTVGKDPENIRFLHLLDRERADVAAFPLGEPLPYGTLRLLATKLTSISEYAATLADRLGHNYSAHVTKQCAWRTSATLDAESLVDGEAASETAIFLPKTLFGEAHIAAVSAASVYISLMLYATFDAGKDRSHELRLMGLEAGEHAVTLLQGVRERRARVLAVNPLSDDGTGWYADEWKRRIGELSPDVLEAMLFLVMALAELLNVPQIHPEDVCYEGLSLDTSTTVLALLQVAAAAVGPGRAAPSPFSSFLEALFLCMRGRRLADACGLIRVHQKLTATATTDKTRSIYYADLMRGASLAAAIAIEFATANVAFGPAEDMLSVLYVATDELLGNMRSASATRRSMLMTETAAEDERRGLFGTTMLLLAPAILDTEKLINFHCSTPPEHRVATDEQLRLEIRGAASAKNFMQAVELEGMGPLSDII